MTSIPDSNAVFPNAYKTSCFIKNVITAPNISVGDYVYGGNPARLLKPRFDAELTGLLLRLRWWDLPPQELVELLPLLCDPDLEKVRRQLKARLGEG